MIGLATGEAGRLPLFYCGPSGNPTTQDPLADMVMFLAGKFLTRIHIPGPLGVRGRNSDNTLIAVKLAWRPTQPLFEERVSLSTSPEIPANPLSTSQPPRPSGTCQ